MTVKCVWEHNGNDSIVYCEDFVGAFTRGPNKEIALSKMQNEIESYLKWIGEPSSKIEIEIVQEKESTLEICDADSDVLIESEKAPLSIYEYHKLKDLALKSAVDFLSLYRSIPDKNACLSAYRKTFYGKTPQTADEIYEHTKNVNSYYFAEIGVDADNDGDIYECRKRAFENLEKASNFLDCKVFDGSYGELWTVRKVIRRFIWHDRIHAKSLYRRARRIFNEEQIINKFFF